MVFQTPSEMSVKGLRVRYTKFITSPSARYCQYQLKSFTKLQNVSLVFGILTQILSKHKEYSCHESKKFRKMRIVSVAFGLRTQNSN